MEIQIESPSPDLRVVTLAGRLDTAGVGAVELKFNAATAAGAGHHAIADLSAVSFVASMGLRMLIAAARTLAAKERRMVLVVPEGMVAETLRDGGIDQLVTMVPDLAAARAALGFA